jgi:hypothetical protein
MKLIRTRKVRTDVPATVVHNAKELASGVKSVASTSFGYTANTAHRGFTYVRYAAFKASKLPEAYRAHRKAKARKALVRKILKVMLP